jgi:hypothetical protein
MSERASIVQHVPRGNNLAVRSVLRRIKAFYDAEQAERVVRLQNQLPEILWAEMYLGKRKLVSRGRYRRRIDPGLPFLTPTKAYTSL